MIQSQTKITLTNYTADQIRQQAEKALLSDGLAEIFSQSTREVVCSIPAFEGTSDEEDEMVWRLIDEVESALLVGTQTIFRPNGEILRVELAKEANA